ncbi:MAG: WD40 repeat domain-containing protein [Treponema sp.]|jgi:WD40 repeat protein|nr:WD40 repeat domain-containing protein [Treponema sp.]
MKKTLIVAALFLAILSALPAQTPELFLQGHSDDINTVAYSPDGRRIATGSKDNTVKIWDVESGREIRTLSGHTNSVRAAGYSPDGRRIVSGSLDTSAKIWNAETGQEIRTLSGHSGGIRSVAYSPDGRRIVSGSIDKTVKIWNAETGQEIRALTGHNSSVYAVNYSPDGRRIISGSRDNTIKIWDAETGREIRSIAAFEGRIFTLDIAWKPDGSRIAATGGNLLIREWNAETGQETKRITGQGSDDDGFSAVRYSPDGKQIIAGTYESGARIFDANTGRELRSLAMPGAVSAVTYSPDGRRILSGSGDNTAKVWDADTGRELLSLGPMAAGVFRLAFSPDSTRLALSYLDRTIRIWDLRAGRMLRTLTPHQFNGAPALSMSLAWGPDGRRILSGGDDDTIKLLDAATGETLRTIPTGAGSALTVSYSPDGKSILAGLQDKVIKLFDAESGREIRTFTGHTDMVWSAVFSTDGRRVYSGSDDKSIKVWNAATGQLVRTIHDNAHGGRVTVLLAASRKGKEYLLSSGANGRIGCWDPEKTGNEAVSSYIDFGSPVLSAVVWADTPEFFDTPDALAGFANGKIKRSILGAIYEEFPNHAGAVNQMAYSPDGRWLASASSDGTLRLNNVRTSKETAWLIGFGGDEWVCLTPGGWYNASAKGDQFLNARSGNTVSNADRYRSTLYLPHIISSILSTGIDDPLIPPARLTAAERANVKTIESDWGAAVYKELVVARFLGDSAAVSKWETALQAITGRGNATQRDIEAYYRQNIGKSIAETVNEEFNKIRFSLISYNASYNAVLKRNPQNGQYVLNYGGVYKNNETRTVKANSLETLASEMRRNTADFNQTSIDQVREKANLIPAVVFANARNNSPESMAEIVTNFYLNPNAGTYAALRDVYLLYRLTRLVTGNEFLELAASAYWNTLASLYDALAERVLNDARNIQQVTTMSREQADRFVAVPHLKVR